MRNSLLLAAGALVGSTAADVHRAKLQKVPLADQLVSYPSSSRNQNETYATYRRTPTSINMHKDWPRSTWVADSDR